MGAAVQLEPSLVRVSIRGTGEDLQIAGGTAVPSHVVSDDAELLIEAPAGASIWVGEGRLDTWRVGARTFAVVGFKTESQLLGPRRFEVRAQGRRFRFDVATPYALRNVERLSLVLDYFAAWFPRFGGAFWYRDDHGRTHVWFQPSDVATFVIDYGLEIRGLVAELERHRPKRQRSRSRTAPLGHPIDLAATRRLLRRRPELFVEHDDGIFEIGGARYSPQLVVLSRRTHDDETLENRRLKAFLNLLLSDGASARRELEKLPKLPELHGLLKHEVDRLSSAVHRGFLRVVNSARLPGPLEPRTSVEAVDRRYRRLADLRDLYLARHGMGDDESALRRHVPRAHEIYQAFCAYAVAKAYGLRPTGIGLHPATPGGPLFESEEWELYHDQPGHIISWRDDSLFPADYRPDILLRNCESGQIVLVDAKYSFEPGGGVPIRRLEEIQIYLNAFGIERAAMLYPGDVDAAPFTDVEGKGLQIRAIPLLPQHGQDQLTRVRAALDALVCTPGSGFPK